MRTRHSVVGYIGGKHGQAPWIVQHFPQCYQRQGYLEPFAGGLSVFFYKRPSPSEVLNDLDGEIVNLWRVIQSEGKRFAREADKLPYARYLYDQWADEWYQGRRPEDRFERALHFFYFCRSSFSAKQFNKSGWAHSIQKNQAAAYRSAVKDIAWAGRRLAVAQLECRDFRDVIESNDAPDVLIYCDPPFVGTEGYYAVDFTEEDHVALAQLLHEASGKVVLSYYDHPLVRDLYSEGNGWIYDSRITVKASEGVVGDKRNIDIRREGAVELLLTNYETQLSLF